MNEQVKTAGKHTAGPLRLFKSPGGDWSIGASDDHPSHPEFEIVRFGGNKADASRMVDCWNACNGVPDPEAFYGRLQAIASRYRQQRDELREAGKAMIEAFESGRIDGRAYDALEAALAACENGGVA